MECRNKAVWTYFLWSSWSGQYKLIILSLSMREFVLGILGYHNTLVWQVVAFNIPFKNVTTGYHLCFLLWYLWMNICDFCYRCGVLSITKKGTVLCLCLRIALFTSMIAPCRHLPSDVWTWICNNSSGLSCKLIYYIYCVELGYIFVLFY